MREGICREARIQPHPERDRECVGELGGARIVDGAELALDQDVREAVRGAARDEEQRVDRQRRDLARGLTREERRTLRGLALAPRAAQLVGEVRVDARHRQRAEVLGVRDREADVGDAGGAEALEHVVRGRGGERGIDRGADPLDAVDRDRRDQRVLVGEVPVHGRSRHARAPGDVPQRNSVDARFGKCS